MPTDLSGRYIFLASPGGMDEDRRIVREEVARYNQECAERTGVVFLIKGYEDLPGKVARPQAAINPLVLRCDYMMLLVGDQLGSPTTVSPPFRTGIEEELSVAVDALERAEAPMRDIMLTFTTQAPGEIRRSSRALQQVLEFKNMIEATKELYYVAPYPNEVELRRRVWAQLEEWAQPLDPKQPPNCPKLKAALSGTERPVMNDPPATTGDELVRWAEEQAELGLNATADAAFAQAIADGDPRHLHSYARFLQRTGRLDQALRFDQRAFRHVTAAPDDSPATVRLRADLLAHMGLLKRKLGDLRESRTLLTQAVATAQPHADAEEMSSTIEYALDQLGITAERLGDLDDAADAYAEALERRTESKNQRQRAQSLVNLARIARQQQRTDDAIKMLEEAVHLLRDTDSRALANALAALGNATATADPGRAKDLLDQSLQLNRRLDIPDGISVAYNGLARLALAANDAPQARELAEKVLEVNVASGNQQGTAIAYRLLGEVHLLERDADKAVAALRQAQDLVTSQHDPGQEAQVRLAMALACAQRGDTEGVAEQVAAGRAAATSCGDLATLAKLDDLAGPAA